MHENLAKIRGDDVEESIRRSKAGSETPPPRNELEEEDPMRQFLLAEAERKRAHKEKKKKEKKEKKEKKKKEKKEKKEKKLKHSDSGRRDDSSSSSSSSEDEAATSAPLPRPAPVPSAAAPAGSGSGAQAPRRSRFDQPGPRP